MPCLPACREQRRSWLYRIKPAVTHEPFHPLNFPAETLTADFSQGVVTPNQLRWRPIPIPSEPVDFVRGMVTFCGAGGQPQHCVLMKHTPCCDSAVRRWLLC
jgi:homogentisate 1,2-dioxygenase